MDKKSVLVICFVSVIGGLFWKPCIGVKDGFTGEPVPVLVDTSIGEEGGMTGEKAKNARINEENLMVLLQNLLQKNNSFKKCNMVDPFGFYKGKITGTDYAKKLCVKQITQILFGEDGEKLWKAFGYKKNQSGSWEYDGKYGGLLSGFVSALVKDGVVGLTSGFIGAADDAAARGGKKFFSSLGSKFSDTWDGCKRFFFHGGAKPITVYDLGRWSSSVKNMVDGLIEIAENAKTNARIEPDLGLLHLPEFQSDDVADLKQNPNEDQAVRASQSAIDKNWQENAKLYLMRIEQMVAEIEFRQKYYGQYDYAEGKYHGSDSEIYFCLERLKEALQGDVREMVINDQGARVPSGGIYARIAQSKSLSELASTQMVTTLQLFKRHIIGLLNELSLWVKAKIGEEKKKNGNSGGGFPSYGSFDFDE